MCNILALKWYSPYNTGDFSCMVTVLRIGLSDKPGFGNLGTTMIGVNTS